MAFTKFSDWVLARESSAWTRRRKEATAGLQTKPPAAAVHSRSTAGPREDYTKGKKCASKKMKKEATFEFQASDLDGEIPVEDLGLGESEKKMQKNPKLAGFLDQIESLKGDLKVLEDALDKKKKERPKEEEPKEEEPKEEPKPKDEKEPKEEDPKPEEKEEKDD